MLRRAVFWVAFCGAMPLALAESARRTLPELIALARARAGGVGVAQAELAVAEKQKDEAVRSWAPSGEITYFLTGAPRVYCADPRNTSSPLRSGGDDCVTTVGPAGGNISYLNLNIAGVGMQGEIKLTSRSSRSARSSTPSMRPTTASTPARPGSTPPAARPS